MTGIDALCPECGLCCDSTLFADVELRAGDGAARLRELGLSLGRKGGRLAFAQPCACWDGRWCRIYADRPQRCRTFECGLLRRVNAGQLTPGRALKTIASARAQAARVRGLLVANGETNTTRPLAKRYAQAMAAPVDLAAKDGSENRGELMLAVNELMQLVQREFLQP